MAPDILQPYSYTDLATQRTIRVIVLHPEKDFDATLQCRLEHLEIEDSAEPGKEYEAVSYCWGEPIFTHILLCDERVLKINPNVDSLLRHLRRADISQRFWIDGICINQQDLAEKAVQIGLMRDIYFCAMRVHAWLGEDTKCAVEAFTVIRKLAFRRESSRSRWDKRAIDQHASATVKDLLKPEEIQPLSALTTLLARPWFTRRWILQEVRLSHETLVHYGGLSMALSFFQEGLKLLSDGLSETREGSFVGLEALKSLVQQAIKVCECKMHNKRVLQLLSEYRSSKCLDDRDAIFSVLALGIDDISQHATIQKFPLVLPFRVSYSLSAAEVFTRLAMSYMLSGFFAHILCMAVLFPFEGAPS